MGGSRGTGGPDNSLSGSRSDKRTAWKRSWFAQVLLRLRRTDNELSVPPDKPSKLSLEGVKF